MKNKRNNLKVTIKEFFIFVLPLSLLILFVLVPFIWIFITSIKPLSQIVTLTHQYIPSKITLENYIFVFKKFAFSRYFLNSTIVAILSSFFGLTLAATAAYTFSRFKFYGRAPLMLLFLILNMFPAVLFLIPLFILLRSMGLIDTHFGLIVSYSTYAIPFSVWMLTGYFNALPKELEEAAMVDGCTRMQAFRKIVIPLSAPAIIAVTTYIFIYAWNEFTIASIMTQSEFSKTLPVGLYSLMGQFIIDWGILTAGGVLSIIPTIILFSIFQKYLVSGIMRGAVKG